MFIYWDAESQEFKIPTHETLTKVDSTRETTDYVYDYVTNIFKAHGDSIIAAMGADTPGVVFSPGNSENPKDVRAAKKAEQLAKIIHKINNSKLQLLHALFILYTQHMVACYQSYNRDEEYGTVQIPKFKKSQEQITPNTHACTKCNYLQEQPVDSCPQCNSQMQMIPGITAPTLEQVGTEEVNKGFPEFEILGDLNVRIPSYAVTQADCGYLIKYSDQHISYSRNAFPELRDKLSSDDSDTYEKLARAPSNTMYYSESYTNNLVTWKQCWFRNWMFEIIDDEEQAKLLKKTFPKGAYVLFIAGQFAEAKEECLDDCWTITKGDLSRTVHGDPLGKIIIPQQDIENTVDNLLLECLEHSIPVNFADTRVLDFGKYSQQEVKPGLVYPSRKPPEFQSMQDGFFSFKTTTLPKEGTDMQKIIQDKSQFLSGDLPSIYGGPGGGSKTLGEYEQSRQYALGRLSIPSLFIYIWWAKLTHKAVKLYINEMIEDDKFTIQTGDQRFESLYIYRDDFQGKFKLLIPENAGELPISYGQKRQAIQQAMQLNSPEINSFLFSPENLRVIIRYFGVDDLTSSEEIQVQKAFRALSDLLQGQQMMPDQNIDDPTIQLRIFKNYLASDSGQDQKIQNPEGFTLCLQYLNTLKQILIMQQPPAPIPQPQNG